MHHAFEIGGGFVAGAFLTSLYLSRVIAELRAAKNAAKQFGQSAINKL